MVFNRGEERARLGDGEDGLFLRLVGWRLDHRRDVARDFLRLQGVRERGSKRRVSLRNRALPDAALRQFLQKRFDIIGPQGRQRAFSQPRREIEPNGALVRCNRRRLAPPTQRFEPTFKECG